MRVSNFPKKVGHEVKSSQKQTTSQPFCLCMCVLHMTKCIGAHTYMRIYMWRQAVDIQHLLCYRSGLVSHLNLELLIHSTQPFAPGISCLCPSCTVLWLPFDLHNHLPWMPGICSLVFILLKQIVYLLSHLLSTPSGSLAVWRSQDGLRNAQQLHKAARDAFMTEGIWWTQQGQENL